jgi:nucleoside-diphosphate-sugar epimerase
MLAHSLYTETNRCGAREASEDDFGRPVRLYGWHKVLNEVTAQRYDRTCVTRFIGLRISSVYGAGREIGLSAPINALLASARSGTTAQSPWSGDTEFNVIHVDDVAEAIAALATAPNPEHSVYNSGGETVSIGDLERTVRAVNPLAEITYAEPPVPPFAHCSRIDWSRLRTEYGLRRSSIEERLTVEVANARKAVPS